MKQIQSFCINHDILEPGIYTSRIDDNITTYDIRMVKPNTPPFLSNKVLHTFEHLFATISRNSKYSDNIVYFGPMGCRTGCYFLVKDLPAQTALDLIIDIVKQISEYEGEIPGTKPSECGNYKEHDKEGCIQESKQYYNIIKNWTVEDLEYKD